MNFDFLLNGYFWEIASYVVTVIALPGATAIFIYEQRKERQNEDEELYQRLSDEYAEFSKLLLDNADLGLLTQNKTTKTLTPEQIERKSILFDILISLFERAYILVYEQKMNEQTRRLWASWDDYIRFWCAREDFREALPGLLQGEDPDFGTYIRGVVKQLAPKP